MTREQARLGPARLDPTRLVIPVLTANPLSQSRVYLGMTTLKELIVKRPSRQFQYLHVLLDLSSHEKEKVVPRVLSPLTFRLSPWLT